MIKKFNFCPTIKQNIFIPSRNNLLSILEDLSNEVVDTILPLDELVDKVGFFISDRFRVDVMHAVSLNSVPGGMMINAEYDQEKDEDNKVSIQIILVTYPTDKSFLWDRSQFDYIIKQIADTLIHESAHMKQCRARDFEEYFFEKNDFDSDKEEAQYYLGSDDEIDAYAYNIASELLDQRSFLQANSLLSNPKAITLDISSTLWTYMNTFDHNINNPVIKKIIKKAYKHLTYLR